MSLRARALRYEAGGRALVDGVDLAVEAGEVVALVGPNGAGKSTLVRLLSRVLRPAGGDVAIDGEPLRRLSRLQLGRRVAVVPQAGGLPDGFRGRAVVAMGRTPHLGFLAPEGERDRDRIEDAMRRTATWAFRDRPVEALSGGERQRLVLARALAQEPRYLLLDEPTNHLDLRFQADILGAVRREAERGIGALVVMHDLNLAARACDRMVLLHEGRVVADGTPAEVTARDRLERVYGVAADVFDDPRTGAPVVLPRLP